MDAPRERWQRVQRKSLTVIAQECCELYWTNPGSNIPQSSSYTATCHPSLKPSKSDEQDLLDTAGEVRINSSATYSSASLHTDEQLLGDQLELMYSSSVRRQDVALKTSRKRWTIETSGEGESGKSVLVARHDDISLESEWQTVNLGLQ